MHCPRENTFDNKILLPNAALKCHKLVFYERCNSSTKEARYTSMFFTLCLLGVENQTLLDKYGLRLWACAHEEVWQAHEEVWQSHVCASTLR